MKEVLAGIDWKMFVKTGLHVAFILIFAWLAVKLLRNILRKFEVHLVEKSKKEGEPPTESVKRIETIVKLVRQAALLALWVVVGMVLLKEFGIEIGPLIAGAGIAGLALGFGGQNLVRDIIAGFFIILENQIRVGDVAVINGTGGLVEQINFRTIVLRDLGGVVHIFPSGTVTTLSNMTNEWSAYVFDIGVAYKENTDKVIDILKQVGKSLLEDSRFGDFMLGAPEIFGVDKFDDSAVVIKGRIRTKPIQQWTVGREFLRRVKYAFDENGIEIPFPHRTLYFGEASKPVDLKIFGTITDPGSG